MNITYPRHANLLVESNKINFMCDPLLVADNILVVFLVNQDTCLN